MEEEKLEKVSDEIKMAHLGKQSVLDQGLVNLSINKKSEFVKVSIETPEGKERVANDIVCVLDISGSMATEAHVKNSEGVKEKHGLSYLDLLKHATKTIISNLNQNDRFGLVSYSDDARIEVGLMEMTDENKQLAMFGTENLQDEGCTNLWSGLQEGLDMLRKNEKEGQHKSIILLTDGEPNIFPPSGFIQQLEKYKNNYPNFNFGLNSFAFGKYIDTPLLDEYATIGNGQYSFIPCPGFIGTVFVNSISNILNTMASNCELNIELMNGVRAENVPGGLPFQKKGKKISIKVGDLKFGQNRDIILQLRFPDGFDSQKPYMNVNVKYYDYLNKKVKIGTAEQVVINEQFEDPLVDAHYCRVYFVDKVREGVEKSKSGNMYTAQQIVQELSDLISQKIKGLEDIEYDLDEDTQEFQIDRVQQAIKFLQGLKKDVDGEVKLGFGRIESFNHWGKHFLPSLNHAHLKQQCNNFCDPGIQGYGGKFFREIKEQVEQTFLKMPAPKPSKKQPRKPNNNHKNNNNNHFVKSQPQQLFQQQQPQVQQQQQEQEQNNNINMEDYYNAGGGCFEGNGDVLMIDGSFKKVKDLKKGDRVIGKDGEINTIKVVVQIKALKSDFELYEVQGLKITGKHPIFMKNEWIKPKDVGMKIDGVRIVYNFVLENQGNSLRINGIDCVSLGHGLKGKNVEHSYFGSQRVIQDLEKIKGFQDGRVCVYNEQFIKRAKNQNESMSYKNRTVGMIMI